MQNKFFGAVSKNGRAAAGLSKKDAISPLTQNGIERHNISVFVVTPSGTNAVQYEPDGQPKFPMEKHHHTALTDVALAFAKKF